MVQPMNLVLMTVLALCLQGCGSEAVSQGEGGASGVDELVRLADESKGYRPLFKDDLSNATFTKGMWEFKGEVLGIDEEAAKVAAARAKRKNPDQKMMRDIWTKKRFGDFILDLEFKCDESTNSGVFLRTDDIVQWLHTGIEIQIMQGRSTKNARHDTGAVYDCLSPREHAIKPAGQWNRYTIICKDNWIHIILNGKRVTDMDLDLWTKAGKNPDGTDNKFENAYKDMSRNGHIGLQYHGHPVWFRNMRVKTL